MKKFLYSFFLTVLVVIFLLQAYMNTGYTYEPFRSLKKRGDVERYTYTLGQHEIEYELPSKSIDFYTYVAGCKLYFPYNWIACKDNEVYGVSDNVMKVYMTDGEVHTIHPSINTSFLGKTYGVVCIDGVEYLTDRWYTAGLDRLLSSFKEDRNSLIKELQTVS